jgi:hypothetical protein
MASQDITLQQIRIYDAPLWDLCGELLTVGSDMRQTPQARAKAQAKLRQLVLEFEARPTCNWLVAVTLVLVAGWWILI